ncbi:MAG: hypothetical protein JEZ12_25575 [Desulfobacterium sp.]|nr:hypothetical protein [Desulfobacterium sp.]
MTINDIGGTNFDSLQLYGEMTGTQQDDRALATLNDEILAAVPGATPEEVGQTIDRIKAEKPNWTMDQVFEAAIKELNPSCEAETINTIRAAWQEFTGVSNLSNDDIGNILASPLGFVTGDDQASERTIKETLAVLMLLMIEIAGEESANQMFEGFQQRDEIMTIAMEKADDIRTKAVISMVVGLASAAVQIGGSAMSMGGASKGLNAAKVGNVGLAQAHGGMSSAWSGLGQGGSAVVNSVAGLLTGMIDAEIAIKDGESQVAGIQKETADKLRQKVGELIQACMNLLQAMNQADYQTMTAIGRA